CTKRAGQGTVAEMARAGVAVASAHSIPLGSIPMGPQSRKMKAVVVVLSRIFTGPATSSVKACEGDAVDPNDVGVILGAYLTGSIPFSQRIANWRTGLNLHEVGEGNVGSRNVWHVAGPRWGLLAALLDCLKGFVAYKVSSMLAPPIVALLAG